MKAKPEHHPQYEAWCEEFSKTLADEIQRTLDLFGKGEEVGDLSFQDILGMMDALHPELTRGQRRYFIDHLDAEFEKAAYERFLHTLPRN